MQVATDKHPNKIIMDSQKNPDRKAYYLVEESFYKSGDDRAEYIVSNKILFKRGSILERRIDALQYCFNRERDVNSTKNNKPEEKVKLNNEKELEEYENYYCWTPLPENLNEFKKIEISCSFIIEEYGEFEESILILHTDKEKLSFIDAAHETYLLHLQFLTEMGY